MNTPTSNERGWVLIIAVVVMTLMLGIGLAALSLTDTQTQKSRQERERESSLNLAEGVLYSQSFILALPPTTVTGADQGWPGSSGRAYSGCTPTTGTVQCPSDATLANIAASGSSPASFQNVDTSSSTTTWTTAIQDDGPVGAPSTDYQNAQTNVNWDANADSKVWVRASATVRGHRRTVVGLMQIENLPLPFPRTAISAGSFTLSQKGNQTYIDTGSTSVVLRCSPVTSLTCANYDQTKPQEVTGAPSSIASNTSLGNTLTPTQILELKSKASTFGAYVPTGCPTLTQLLAPVVYVENCTMTVNNNIFPGSTYNCSYTLRGNPVVSNQNCLHGPNQTPFGGQIVWARGQLGFGGGVAFFGVIYHLNQDNCGLPTSDDTPGACVYDANNQSIMVTTAGGGTIVGSVNVDGAGAVEAGNASGNIVYDSSVFKDATVFGTTGLVQNTWQELIPG